MISADNHMAVMATLFAIAGLGFVSEKTRLGAMLTGTVVTILAAILFANLGLIPHSAPAYGFVFSYIVPVLIPLFLFRANLRTIFMETTRASMAFLLAAFGTVAGVTVAALLLDLAPLASSVVADESLRESAVAGLFASTYIGGSVNYAALGDVTGLQADADFFSAATATDNLFSALFLSLLAIMPGWHWLAKRFVLHDHSEVTVEQVSVPVSAMSLTLSLAVALLIVVIADQLVNSFGLSGWRYVLITLLTLLLATLWPGAVSAFAGSFELGVGLSFVFFAAIAAGANIVAMIEVAPLLVSMVLILLTVHALVTFGLGALLRLSLPELITASNAAILGATTAPALAATKGWHNLVTPGVLVGVLGYALGTLIGTLIFRYWGFSCSIPVAIANMRGLDIVLALGRLYAEPLKPFAPVRLVLFLSHILLPTRQFS